MTPFKTAATVVLCLAATLFESGSCFALAIPLSVSESDAAREAISSFLSVNSKALPLEDSGECLEEGQMLIQNMHGGQDPDPPMIYNESVHDRKEDVMWYPWYHKGWDIVSQAVVDFFRPIDARSLDDYLRPAVENALPRPSRDEAIKNDIVPVSKPSPSTLALEIKSITKRYVADCISDKKNETVDTSLVSRRTVEIMRGLPPVDRAARAAVVCDGPCGKGLNLFTVWTTPPDTWVPMMTRSIDSALYHHPMATVTIYSSSLPQSFVSDWVDLGYDVRVEPINIKERAKGTPIEAWASRIEEWREKSPFFFVHLSDVLRLLILYNHGGIYFDTDVVFVKSFERPGVQNIIGYERGNSVCNAVLVFDRQNLFVLELMNRIRDQYNPNGYYDNGPPLITHTYVEGYMNSSAIHAVPKMVFFPLAWGSVDEGFIAANTSQTDRWLDVLNRKSLAIHLWNSRLIYLKEFADSSLMAQVFRRNCVLCRDVSSHLMEEAQKYTESLLAEANTTLDTRTESTNGA